MEEFMPNKITGILPTMLPAKTALVLEGGGMRGYFSAGVMDAFLRADMMFPYIIGVSAGAGNGVSYVSGQMGRNRKVAMLYATDKRYLGLRNFITDKSIMGMDFIFREIPQKHIFFDWDTFQASPARFLTGALDCQEGRTIWYEKEAIDPEMNILMASCSLPVFAPMVTVDGRPLVDGGILDPIPIQKSIEDGNDFHVIVLTRHKGYQKTASPLAPLAKSYFRDYPKLAEILTRRHEDYNEQLALCEELERQGKALILRPNIHTDVSRMEGNREKILRLYEEGEHEGRIAVEQVKWHLSQRISA